MPTTSKTPTALALSGLFHIAAVVVAACWYVNQAGHGESHGPLHLTWADATQTDEPVVTRIQLPTTSPRPKTVTPITRQLPRQHPAVEYNEPTFDREEVPLQRQTEPTLELAVATDPKKATPEPIRAVPMPRRWTQPDALSTSPATAIPISISRRGKRYDTLPRKLATNPQPDYPTAARTAGVEGTAFVLATVESDGSVSAAVIAATSGWSSLDNAAVTAVLGWEFAPARLDGRPVRLKIRVPVTFRLRKF